MSDQKKSLPKRRVKRGWMGLKISRIFSDNPSTKTLYFEDEEDGGCQFDYKPGQYLTFRFDSVCKKPVVRSYTMSSSPCQKGFVAVTVREVEDPFISRFLCQDSQVGDVLRARGPIGRFGFDSEKDHSHLVMIAGGSGVTPFVSIMREYASSLGEKTSPLKMTLFVTFRSKKELMCWEALESLKAIKGIDLVVTLSRQKDFEENDFFQKGRVSTELLEKHFEGNYSNKTFMTCGPDAMMKSMASHLEAKGVEKEHIKLESFD